MKKYCSGCGEDKELSEFSRRLGAVSARCKECVNESSRLWRKNNPERALAADRAKVAKKPEKYREISRAKRRRNPKRYADIRRRFRERNREKRRAESRLYYAQNKEKAKAASRRWALKNPARMKANKARRRSCEITATPQWADVVAIKRFYDEAQRISADTGVLHHVDHIVPLNSPIVCGLHCQFNLQILEGAENARKSNRRWPDMPSDDVWHWVASDEFKADWRRLCSNLPHRKRPPSVWEAIPPEVRSRMATERNLKAWARRTPQERKQLGRAISLGIQRRKALTAQPPEVHG